jgi:hypothetical protein
MTRSLDSIRAELPATARARVRIPDRFPSTGLFPGWGPGLGRS